MTERLKRAGLSMFEESCLLILNIELPSIEENHSGSSVGIQGDFTYLQYPNAG